MRDAKVDDNRLPVLQHDVRRLEVTVDDPGRVDGLQRLGQAEGQPVERRAAQRAGLADRRVQRPPGHVSGHDVRRGAADIGVKNLRHVPAPDPAHGLDLARQALPGVRVSGHRGAEDLDRDRAVIRVPGKVDNTHTALADLLDRAVGADLARERFQSRHLALRVRRGSPISMKP
jgi:hypothetical protein